MNLLMLAHRIPYPPNKGDKIRSWNELRHLAARHRVHLGCLVDDERDFQHLDVLRRTAASCAAFPLAPRRARLASLTALAGRTPLSVRYCASRRLAAWVRDVAAREQLDAVLVFSSQMAQYVWHLDVPRVMDFCDVDSAKWAEYAERARLPLRALYGLEARRLGAWERAVLERFEAATLVTEAERRLWADLDPRLLSKVQVVPNGVDLEFFAPGAVRDGPPDPAALVFTGAMDYAANVDAVTFFAHEVLPRIQAEVPQARFFVVGSRPTPAVQALGRRPGVVVTGFVEDVRTWYARAAVCVVPLRIARGIQNKVLEAMAMGRPVLCSEPAFRGLGARAGREVEVATDAPDVAARAVALLRDPGRAEGLGAAGRRFVERHYVWDTAMRNLEGILAGVAGHAAEPPVEVAEVHEPTRV